MSFIRNTTSAVGRVFGFMLRTGVRVIAAFSWSRWVLNAIYLRLTPVQRSRFHKHFAKIFRTTHIRGRDGRWIVCFANKKIHMPLTSTEYWLDWDSAVSIVGTDIAVKQTYEALIDSSSERPELFVDIGANYGTHSLLFLAQGIESITFEPNSSCHDYFIKLCKLNMVTPRLEQVALGDREGYVELSYPPRDTWLGSTDAETKHKLSLSQELITETVEQRMLDDYVAEIKRNRTLIKIDTEGNELAVLRGAMHILQEYGPKIIFESWGGNDRTDLFDLFTVYGYSIYQLPWSPRHTTNPLALQHFTECQSTNFIAIPESHSNSS